ncbi:HPP family protein [Rhizohabitans arisaemae]|uniref:HPP family protein n=1 Tax=Rhizohabitans arisaemae TaxID=2720610 RepID=UPI0024B1CBB8|nr:HPP family protein [Rhizohabitans arisaemae]
MGTIEAVEELQESAVRTKSWFSRSWPSSQAPPRLGPAALAITTVTSVGALATLALIGFLVGEPVLIPSLAASMALVAGAPSTPLAQPRNVVVSQLVCALVGFAAHWTLGSSPWSAALAGGLALGAMLACRASHSPAAATAIIVTVTGPPIFPFLPLLALSTVVMVAAGFAGARAQGIKYPVYWW